MSISTVGRLMLRGGFAMALAALTAAPAAAQDEILFDNCEGRLFRYSDMAGYSCRGTGDSGSFEDECVCFHRESSGDGEFLSPDFEQFRAADCTSGTESPIPVQSRPCACTAVGGELRASSSYICAGGTLVEGFSNGELAFRAAQAGKVGPLGYKIWPGNSLSSIEIPAVSSVYVCKRSLSCQQQCDSCVAVPCQGAECV